EQAMNHADDASPTGARLDDPLRGQRGRAGTLIAALSGEPVGRLPGRHDRRGIHARTKVTRDGPPWALVDLGRDEPGRDAWPGRDGLPDLLGRAGDLNFHLDPAAS